MAVRSLFSAFSQREHSSARWASQRDLLKLGVPIGLSVLFEVTSFTFMAVLIARLGTASVAGHQMVANMAAILFMVPLALGVATSVLVAQSLGAGAPASRASPLCADFAVDSHCAGGCDRSSGCCVSRSWRCIRSTRQSLRSRCHLIGWAAVFHVFDAVQGVAGFALRGYKNTFWPMVIYGVSLWGVGLVGGYWIAFHETPLGRRRGALGFWEAATVAVWRIGRVSSLRLAAPTRSRERRQREKKRPGVPALDHCDFGRLVARCLQRRDALLRSADGSRTAPAFHSGVR